MKREITPLSPEISRGLRDSFRDEARGKIPILMSWSDLQRLPNEVVAHSMIIGSAKYIARFNRNIAQMPDAGPDVYPFMQKFTDVVADGKMIASESPFTYPHLFEWLLAGGVQAGEARYPYFEDFIPEFAYYLNKRNCFNPEFFERASPLLVRTPIELGYFVGRGLVPDWVKAAKDY